MKYQYQPDDIKELCHTHTNLNDEEIASILDVAKVLPYFAEIFDTEAFIDIKSTSRDVAIVVAEQFRSKSIFQHSYLGELIYREDEPAIFQAFDLGRRVSSAVAVSHDKTTGNKILTHQTCVPILHQGKTVAVLSEGRGLSCEVREPEHRGLSGADKAGLADLLLQVFAVTGGGGAQEGVLIFNSRGELEYSNPMAKQIYRQLGFDKIEGQHFDNLNFAPQHFEDYMACARGGGDLPVGPPQKYGEAEVCINGRFYNSYLVIEQGEQGRILLCIRDTTEARRNENDVKNYLVTYREIHHRIKNNLQTVASILRLQMYNCAEEKARGYMEESVNRILSIAATHDLLSQKSGDQGFIQDVLKKICASLVDCNTATGTEINFFVEGDNFPLDSDRLVVVSLVTTELIQNSVKHAFRGRDHGTVRILVSAEGDVRRVEVRDDGNGYDVSTANEGSLGLTIVRSYVDEKLHGQFAVISGEEGTSASFAFLS